MNVIAIEGPCYSGKSTLVRALQSFFAPACALVLCDYVYAGGGPKSIPSAPIESADKQMGAFQFFLNLDHQRYSYGLSVINSPDVIIMDRSVHTLLAHNFAMDRLNGWSIFHESCRIAAESPLITWPQVVVYLDALRSVLKHRYPAVITKDENLFTDPAYNRHFRDYFVPKPRFLPTGETEFWLLPAALPTILLAEIVMCKMSLLGMSSLTRG